MSFMSVNFDKGAVTVDDLVVRVIDLLEADEVIADGLATKYKRGTGQSEVLLQKSVDGSTCATDVSLIGG